MNSIKQRRLNSTLNSYPNLRVGDCVPFYFCPRSIMLYLIHQANHPEYAIEAGKTLPANEHRPQIKFCPD